MVGQWANAHVGRFGIRNVNGGGLFIIRRASFNLVRVHTDAAGTLLHESSRTGWVCTRDARSLVTNDKVPVVRGVQNLGTPLVQVGLPFVRAVLIDQRTSIGRIALRRKIVGVKRVGAASVLGRATDISPHPAVVVGRVDRIGHSVPVCVTPGEEFEVHNGVDAGHRKRVIDGTGSGTLTRRSQGLRIKLHCNLVTGVGLSGQREGRGGENSKGAEDHVHRSLISAIRQLGNFPSGASRIQSVESDGGEIIPPKYRG